MLTKGAIGNLVNRYKAVLKKCNLINTFGSLAVASMLVMGGAGVAGAEEVTTSELTLEANKEYSFETNGKKLKTVNGEGASLTLTAGPTSGSGAAIYDGDSAFKEDITFTVKKLTLLNIDEKDRAAMSNAIYLTEGHKTTINAEEVYVKSKTSNAVFVNVNSHLEFNKINTLNICTEQSDRYAIYLPDGNLTINSSDDGATITLGKLKIGYDGTNATYDGIFTINNANGTNTIDSILANASSTSTNHITISGETTVNNGITIKGGTFNITGNTTAKANVTSGDAYAILQEGGTATFNGAVTATASGTGVVRGLRAIGGSTMNIGNADSDVTITVSGNSNDLVAVQAKESNTVMNIAAKNFTVKATHDGSDTGYGILAQNTTTNADTPAKLNIEAENINITVANSKGERVGSAIVAMSQGQLDLKGNVTASAENAILARGNATANVNIGSADTTVDLTGNINFNWAANSKSKVDADVNVVLNGDKSKWEGNSLVSWADMDSSYYNDESYLKVTGLNVTLSEKAVWTPTQITDADDVDANGKHTGQRLLAINTLTMDDGIIEIHKGVAATVDTLTGSGGSINMEDTSGSFTATTADASTTLTVQAIKEDGTVKNADEVTPEELEALKAKVTADNATIEAKAPEADIMGDTTVDQNGNVTVARNSLMDAALQASVTSISLDKILTNDVRKRLGDIRADQNTTGVWMRWDGGKLKGDAGVTNDFNTIQIGGDTKVAKNCRLGVTGSFTHGDTEFARGTGELEGFSFAAYATWMGENGMFADVVARLGHFSTEMQVEGRTGDIDSRVASLSGEYGWRFNLCEQFFIEPQVELAYTYVSSDDMTLGDAKYHFDDVDSLTGRAGLVAGWNLPNDMGNLYARASVVQQFMGDAKISGVKGDIHNIQEIDGQDTWLEYGIGANIKLTDSTYIWADVERTEGATIEEEWRGTVGLRISF